MAKLGGYGSWGRSAHKRFDGTCGEDRRNIHENDVLQMNSDLFGGGDCVVKYVLEGHDRGVNWAVRFGALALAGVLASYCCDSWQQADTYQALTQQPLEHALVPAPRAGRLHCRRFTRRCRSSCPAPTTGK